MKKLLLVSWFSIFSLLLSLSLSEASLSKVEVLKVFNCYSFKIKTPEGTAIVRIAEVNCAENLFDNYSHKKNAQKVLAALLEGKEVILDYWATDVAGRLVCEVFLLDGRSVGPMLIARGYALQDRYYSFSDKLKLLQESAKELKRGVWKDLVAYSAL